MSEQVGVYKGRRSDEWATPSELFDKLYDQYQFTFDVSASENNAKIDEYWTKEDDALSKDWTGRSVDVQILEDALDSDPCEQEWICVNVRRYWMNPPFSQANKFFKKVAEESKRDLQLVAIYKSANLESKTWQDYILRTADWVFFLRGRVNFDSHAGKSNQVPFGSALIGYGLEPPVGLKGVLWTLKER